MFFFFCLLAFKFDESNVFSSYQQVVNRLLKILMDICANVESKIYFSIEMMHSDTIEHEMG